MDEYDEQIEDTLAVHALQGLSPEEAEAVEAYLAAHPEAAAELAEYEQAVSALGFAAPPLQPSADAEAALLARVDADARRRTASSAQTASPPPQTSSWRTFFSALLARPAFGAASLAFAAVLVVWTAVLFGRNSALQVLNEGLVTDNVQLSAEVSTLNAQNDALAAKNDTLNAANSSLENQVRDLTQANGDLLARVNNLDTANAALETEIASLLAMNAELTEAYAALETDTESAQQVLALLTSPTVEAVTIPGNPETQPEAQGQLLVDGDRETAVLVVAGMEPPPQGSVYQVLLIHDTGHETADTFVVDTQGESVLIVHSEQPLSTFNAVGVSVEPAGGSPQRTGDIVLLGSIN